MARQAPAASACQGPPFAPHRPPSLFLRKSDLLLGNTVPLDIGIGYPKVLHRIHLPVPASRRQNLGLRWQLRDYPQRASIRVVCLVQAPITTCCMRPKAITRSVGPGTTHLVFGSTQGSPAASTVAQSQFLTYSDSRQVALAGTSYCTSTGSARQNSFLGASTAPAGNS